MPHTFRSEEDLNFVFNSFWARAVNFRGFKKYFPDHFLFGLKIYTSQIKFMSENDGSNNSR
jgi:hypothetical protein